MKIRNEQKFNAIVEFLNIHGYLLWGKYDEHGGISLNWTDDLNTMTEEDVFNDENLFEWDWESEKDTHELEKYIDDILDEIYEIQGARFKRK